jgi:hypothetical protein
MKPFFQEAKHIELSLQLKMRKFTAKPSYKMTLNRSEANTRKCSDLSSKPISSNEHLRRDKPCTTSRNIIKTCIKQTTSQEQNFNDERVLTGTVFHVKRSKVQ